MGQGVVGWRGGRREAGGHSRADRRPGAVTSEGGPAHLPQDAEGLLLEV